MVQTFFQIIPPNTKYDFVNKGKVFFIISMLAIVGSIGLLSTKGLKYGVDFTGGTELHVRFAKAVSAGEVRQALDPIGFKGAMVQGFGEEGEGEFLIRVEASDVTITSHEAELQTALDQLGKEAGGAPKLRFSEGRLYATFAKPMDVAKVSETIDRAKISDLAVESVVPFGRASDHEYLVTFAGVSTQMIDALREHFGKNKVEILQVDQIGPKVGSELRWQAIGAVLISLLFILIYIWFRFDFEFAPGAIMALAHDALGVLGVFSLLGLQFDLPIVAAVLTIVGYSINDTIVLFDRVRENIRKAKDPRLSEVINDSINQTLSRTILTSGTSMVAALALLFLGGPITYNFALAFAIGIFFGTYSSIFVASPITLFVHDQLQKRRSS